MAGKEETIAALRAEFEAWERLIADMGEAAVSRPLRPSHWTLKDVIAHLRDWQKRSIARAEAAARGGEPQFPQWPAEHDPEQEGQPHDLNSWLYEQSRAQPWPDVHREWRAGFQRLLALGAAIPEEALMDQGRYPWLEGHSLAFILQASQEHHEEHRQLLLDWRRGQGEAGG